MFPVVFLTLFSQAAIVLASLALPVLAPAAAVDIGVSASAIGYFSSFIYLGAISSSLISVGFINRFGGIRMLQASLGLAALGVVIVASGHISLIIIGAILIGFSYGPANPTSSRLLVRYVPRTLQNFYFSVKQTSVPVAGTLAGFALPVITAFAGWRVACLLCAIACISLIVVAGVWRRKLDTDRDPAASLSATIGFKAVALVLYQPRLRRLALSCTAFASLQFVYTSFFVAIVTQQAGLSLVIAGAALSAAMAISAGTRLFWGWIADLFSGNRILALLGIGMGVLFFALYFVDPSWSVALIFGLSMAIGITAVSWNGIFLSEIARAAPADKITDATAGSMVFMFAGGLIAPATFSLLEHLTGDYLTGFMIVTALAIFGGLTILKQGPISRH
jgi:MFS family permease